MDRFVYQECKSITKALLNRLICKPFWAKDKENDFYKVIKNPVTLEEIHARLKKDGYKRFEEWLHDINLIWKNAFIYYDETDMEYLVAMDMKQWVYKRLSSIPLKPSGEWICRLKKVSSRLCEITK